MGTLSLRDGETEAEAENRIEFREIAFGKHASERVLCGNSGDQSLHLTALGLPAFAAFRTEPEVISPGSEADIVVTIDTSLIPAEKVGSFTFPIIIEGVRRQRFLHYRSLLPT